MRFAIVKSSVLSQENRWDAGFHITLHELRGRLEQLRASMSAERARELLDKIPLGKKRPLLVLGRGGHRGPVMGRETIDRIEKEYPHLSLAVMEPEFTRILDQAREDVLRYQRIADELQKMAAEVTGAIAAETETDQEEDQDPQLEAPASEMAAKKPGVFQAGFIYPLKDKERYDDDLGTGYDHVAVPHDADDFVERCSLLDCWIVNKDGEVHPGYDANPVPIQREDVEIDEGVRNPKDLPKPKSIFEGPWFRS